jgi:hypothetical protein
VHRPPFSIAHLVKSFTQSEKFNPYNNFSASVSLISSVCGSYNSEQGQRCLDD